MYLGQKRRRVLSILPASKVMLGTQANARHSSCFLFPRHMTEKEGTLVSWVFPGPNTVDADGV
jgi:hypothetical protein